MERFIRWLNNDGCEVILLRAGGVDKVTNQTWGTEIAVRDPLGLHPEEQDVAAPHTDKEYSPLVTLAASLLFNPDPGILWARRAARHPLVLEHGQNADFVLSTSPPESAHLCAATLAKKLRTKLMVDMRDGWMDEPLKPSLMTSRLQRFREGRLEKKVLSQADSIFVTSVVWQELLVERLPCCTGKTVVLTNCYPADFTNPSVSSNKTPLTILYAGKLSLSRSTQKASLLLAPLLSGINLVEQKGSIEFMGKMAQEDLEEIAVWTPRFAEAGWRIVVSPAVPMQQAREKIAQASGLLLLCEAHAALPAKLFEYLAARKPIMSVGPPCSALERTVVDIPQFFHIDSSAQAESLDNEKVKSFLDECVMGSVDYLLPEAYSEDYVAKEFLTHVR